MISFLEMEKTNEWKWWLKDVKQKENPLKVFSCFAGVGGSSMGYKLAGHDVIGCLELDKKPLELYKKNLNPKYFYNMDIRYFNKIPNEDLPKELFNLDILDGSPPCTTFSTVGQREKSWGVEKKFAEGQKEQTLDDLIMVFAKTAEKLKPKFIIMENVQGLLFGNAIKYVNEYEEFLKSIGYSTKIYSLDSSEMGVPQKRKRVFCISVRDDVKFDFKHLDLRFNYYPIAFGEVKEGEGFKIRDNTNIKELFKHVIPSDKSLSDINKRLYNKHSRFNDTIVFEKNIVPTVTSGAGIYRGEEKEYFSKEDLRNVSTFPQDYDFLNLKKFSPIKRVCGMSVPPLMITQIVRRLEEAKRVALDYLREGHLEKSE